MMSEPIASCWMPVYQLSVVPNERCAIHPLILWSSYGSHRMNGDTG